MKTGYIAVVAAILICVAVYFLYPPLVQQRKAEQLLDNFRQSVATKDRAKIREALQQYLADTARITLKVSVVSLLQPHANKSYEQDLDKSAFITFVDNVLYTMSDYGYEPELQDFELQPGHEKAAIDFTSKEWSTGPVHYAGVAIGMHFSSDTTCSGQVAIGFGHMRLNEVKCDMSIRTFPSPEETHKLQNPEVMRQWLR